ncbi:MAG TPA: helix-turn-helix domain-containing protein, partial [Thermoanaerobaculia bacterium]
MARRRRDLRRRKPRRASRASSALRTRLREAAMRLATNDQRVIDVALDCGFGNLSNFNRTFRAEFGVTRTGRTRVSACSPPARSNPTTPAQVPHAPPAASSARACASR